MTGRLSSALLVSALLLGLIGSAPARADKVDDQLFRSGNQAYASGKYDEARQRYEALVRKRIRSEVLLYNLGNTYFRLNQLGRAIWAYERALRIDPDHPEARHNLVIAQEVVASRVRDKVVGVKPDPFWMRTVKAFSTTTASLGFFVLWYLAFGLTITVLLIRRGVLRSVLIALASLVGAAALALGLIYYGRIHLDERVKQAVVLEDKVTVREGPRGIATRAFDIHAGLKVEVTVREDRWLKIRLPNGLEGWVRAEQVGEL